MYSASRHRPRGRITCPTSLTRQYARRCKGQLSHLQAAGHPSSATHSGLPPCASTPLIHPKSQDRIVVHCPWTSSCCSVITDGCLCEAHTHTHPSQSTYRDYGQTMVNKLFSPCLYRGLAVCASAPLSFVLCVCMCAKYSSPYFPW